MEGTLSRAAIIQIYNGLITSPEAGGMNYEDASTTFKYAVERNQDKLESLVKVIQKQFKPDEKYEEYQQEIIKVNEKFAVKVDGKAKIISTPLGDGRVENRYDIDPVMLNEQDSPYNKAIAAVSKKYETTIKKYQEAWKKYMDFLEGEEKIDFYELNKSEVPEKISKKHMNLIWRFLVD